MQKQTKQQRREVKKAKELSIKALNSVFKYRPTAEDIQTKKLLASLHF